MRELCVWDGGEESVGSSEAFPLSVLTVTWAELSWVIV